MNILFLHSSKNFSGGEKVTLEIIKGLKKSEHFTAYIACQNRNTDFIDASLRLGVHVVPLEITNLELSKPIKSITNTLIFYRLLKKLKIDLVQVVDPVGHRFSAIGSFLARVPSVFHFHYPYSNNSLAWFFNKLPKPKHFVFCCDAIRAKMSSTLKNFSRKSHLITIHNGVDLELFSLKKKCLQPIANIVIVGNLQKRKGHSDFLNMARLLRDNYDFTFHIIGDDVEGENNKERLIQLSNELGIQDKVVFHGFVGSVHELLHDMDILICASYEEAFPLNILEAMAIGLPIVSTNVDGIPEAIIDGHSGFLVPPGSPKELAEKVSFLANNKKKRQAIVNNASLFVQDKFSIQRFQKEFCNFYLSLDIGTLHKSKHNDFPRNNTVS